MEMGTKNEKITCSWWVFILIIALNTTINCCVESLPTLDKNKFRPKPKGTVKTIEVPEDGDIIDCVDFYKQPAFDNPLIRNLKMTPSRSFMSLFNRTSQPKLIQNWHKYGECPEGTIPIRRTWNNDTLHRKNRNDNIGSREYASAHQTLHRTYHGGGAIFNPWNPLVSWFPRLRQPDEFSSSQLWIISGSQPPVNTIEVGWIVYPRHFHDSQTRLFTYWTGDSYVKTGCYNLDCKGFVQTDHSVVLGGVVPASIYGGRVNELVLSVSRDWKTDQWWLFVNDKQVGFFPPSLFTSLHKGADLKVEFGGEIKNERYGNRHTSTQMGSGRFPVEDYQKASYIRNIMVVDDQYNIIDASMTSQPTKPACYTLQFGPPETTWKSHFYFGGPGYSHQCP